MQYKEYVKKIFFALSITVSLVSLNGCDDYQGAVNIKNRNKITTPTLGDILLENHNIINFNDYNKNSTNKAVGVVFSGKTTEHPALVVLLKEVEKVYCDSIGLSCGTNTDIKAYDGFKNTTALYASGRSPLAKSMFAFHEYGQSDYIPSVAEMRLLSHLAPEINKTILALGGTPIALEGNTWYWTSTEVAANTTMQAWLCSTVNGGIQETPKNESHKARAILRINYPD